MTLTKTTAQSCRAQRKKGFTLTEIAIVLGIIGLILGAVWTAASGVYASTNAGNFAQSMGQYVAAIRSACNNNCTAVPTVAISEPNITNSNVVQGTPSISTATNTSGDIILTYTMPSTMNKQSTAVGSGLIAAANTTGALFGVGVDGDSDAPSCTGQATGSPPQCSSNCPNNFTCSYVGSYTCPSSSPTPTGTCSIVWNNGIVASKTYQFVFSPSF
jgi:prepilin-type N-terminal cleavage/methylation domain-containing protein